MPQPFDDKHLFVVPGVNMVQDHKSRYFLIVVSNVQFYYFLRNCSVSRARIRNSVQHPASFVGFQLSGTRILRCKQGGRRHYAGRMAHLSRSGRMSRTSSASSTPTCIHDPCEANLRAARSTDVSRYKHVYDFLQPAQKHSNDGNLETGRLLASWVNKGNDNVIRMVDSPFSLHATGALLTPHFDTHKVNQRSF